MNEGPVTILLDSTKAFWRSLRFRKWVVSRQIQENEVGVESFAPTPISLYVPVPESWIAGGLSPSNATATFPA
jgi:hypothetical protein